MPSAARRYGRQPACFSSQSIDAANLIPLSSDSSESCKRATVRLAHMGRRSAGVSVIIIRSNFQPLKSLLVELFHVVKARLMQIRSSDGFLELKVELRKVCNISFALLVPKHPMTLIINLSVIMIKRFLPAYFQSTVYAQQTPSQRYLE